MTARDRTVLIVVGALAVLGAFWMLVISPKRKDASDLSSQIATAQQRLDAAQASAGAAQNAKRQYDVDYATVARLGKAVPIDADVPSLVYTLESTAHGNDVDFRSVDLNTSGAGATPAPTGVAAAVASANGTTPAASASPSAASTALPPGAVVGSAGFPTMPFTFDFHGQFFNLQRFLDSLNKLTSVQGKSIKVKGRLLTIDGFDFKAGPKGFPQIDATVAATAYLLPADEGLTAGATADGAASGTGSTAVASASTTTPSPATASMIGSN